MYLILVATRTLSRYLNVGFTDYSSGNIFIYDYDQTKREPSYESSATNDARTCACVEVMIALHGNSRSRSEEEVSISYMVFVMSSLNITECADKHTSLDQLRRVNSK